MDPRGSPAKHGRGAAWKKVGIGCLAVLGVTPILCTGAIFVASRTNPWLRNVTDASKDMVERSVNSPVAIELKKTLCSDVSVMDSEDVVRFQKAMGWEVSPPDYRWMVSCHVRDKDKAPACEHVATTVRKAHPPDGTLVVVVTAGLVAKKGTTVCSAAWRADGTRIPGTWDVNGKPEAEEDSAPSRR